MICPVLYRHGIKKYILELCQGACPDTGVQQSVANLLLAADSSMEATREVAAAEYWET